MATAVGGHWVIFGASSTPSIGIAFPSGTPVSVDPSGVYDLVKLDEDRIALLEWQLADGMRVTVVREATEGPIAGRRRSVRP